MLISWLQKTTLMDFPGKLATIIFTPWCNLRCKYCHNPQFVLPEKLKNFKAYIPEEIFFNFLKTRIWFLDWVVICWGEPTMQKDLFDFCKKVKDLGFLVKLDTNGTNPEILKKLLENNLLDYVAMDLKTTEKKSYDLLGVEINFEKIKKSIKLLLDSNIDYEFRTTVVKWYHSEDDILELSKLVENAKNYNFQNYNSWKTLLKNFDWKSFSDEELENFQKIALKFVKKSKIRN